VQGCDDCGSFKPGLVQKSRAHNRVCLDVEKKGQNAKISADKDNKQDSAALPNDVDISAGQLPERESDKTGGEGHKREVDPDVEDIELADRAAMGDREVGIEKAKKENTSDNEYEQRKETVEESAAIHDTRHRVQKHRVWKDRPRDFGIRSGFDEENQGVQGRPAVEEEIGNETD
jgi:hypothetical protein